MTETSIHKYLLSSKCIATFARYKFGVMYYQVQIEESYYEFPINTVEETKIYISDPNPSTCAVVEIASSEKIEDYPNYHVHLYDELMVLDVNGIEVYPKRLSKDLGDTSFEAEIRGSELNRWIKKAFKDGTLKLVS